MIMKRKMKSVGVCLLILVSLEVMFICCEGCWKEERKALLSLNSRFEDPLRWVDGSDCCEWERVDCNSSTGRVAKLDLNYMWMSNEINFINYSDFFVFKDLKNLDLSGNGIVGCAENEGLENLEVLDLTGNNLDNAASILSCLDGLSSLKSLYLSYNRFNATTFHVFETLSSKLRNLEVLDVSGNDLTNDILPFLGGFTSLKELYLSATGLDSDLHIQGLCSTLMNLELLDLSDNNFNDTDIASALSGLSSLKSLNLEFCQLTPSSIFNISKLRSLETLELPFNQLNESILRRLEKDGFTWPTGLQVLGLSGNSFSNKFLSSLSGLGFLKSLDLSDNQLEGSLDISGLASKHLKILDFSDNKITDFVVRRDGSGLKMLEELRISRNEFKGPPQPYFANLSSLRKLDISYNYFTGNIGNNFGSLTSLEDFNFQLNKFEVPISFTSFFNHSNLKFIYGDGNKVTLDSHSTLETWIPKFQLQVLRLSAWVETKSLPLPGFLHYQYNLTYLNFTGCKLGGEFPNWLLENNTKMTSLYLRNCSFTDRFQLPSHSLLNLIEMDVSNNTITGQIPSNNMSSIFPNLEILDMSINAIQGSIPRDFGQMNLLDTLDLSNNHLSGEIPHELSNMSLLHTLDLSNNHLSGEIPHELSNMSSLHTLDLSNNHLSGEIPHELSMSSLYTLDLSNNHLSGEIPHELSNMSSLNTLDLSNNQLSGEIPEDIFRVGSQFKFLECLLLDNNSLTGRLPSNIFNTSILQLDISNNHLVGKISSLTHNLSDLVEISMSNNHFEGSIPLNFAELENLVYLDLSQNNLVGPIPSFINSPLKIIHLNNNHLNGLSKRMFHGNSSLVMLDLSFNEITDSIQDMIEDLIGTKLSILLLKGNHFMGDIPKQLCQLIDLSILDLSHNNLSGAIPDCLGKMPFENKDSQMLLDIFSGSYAFYDPYGGIGILIPMEEKASFTSKKRTENYTRSILAYMSGIDLSCNKLKGNIPSELGNLTRIRALNLSHNELTGQIPATFSNLLQTESLDLSFNMLSGQIPPQLSGLTSLEVFSVAHNNLSGATPDGKNQFNTFDESSYEGNPLLCGSPLPKSCNPPPTIKPNDSDTDGDNGSLVDMYVFCVSFAVSYTTALLATAAALYINPYWRRAWFYYMELVSSNCYYFIVNNLGRFSNFRNM